MSTQTRTVDEASGLCTPCASGKRNRFFKGKAMKAEEFRLEQAYTIDRRRLVNRAVIGSGVVHGLGLAPVERPKEPTGQQSGESSSAIDVKPGFALDVKTGFALDSHGREIVVVDTIRLSAANTFAIVQGAGCENLRKIDKLEPGDYVLSIHYAEQRFGDAPSILNCGCGRPEKRFVCETVRFSLEPLKGPCPCPEDKCRRKCNCGAKGCSALGRGPHACLCEWVVDAKVAKDGDSPWCEWEGVHVDPTDGVALACVKLARRAKDYEAVAIESIDDDCGPCRTKDCEPVAFESIDDDCGPRRLVKSNDLLYDLVRGCDLTRIESISWGEWHRNPELMPWDKFLWFLGADRWNPKESDTSPPVETRLTVNFSGAVDKRTVGADGFELSFLVSGPDSGWLENRRAPVVKVDCADPAKNDPEGTTRSATLVVDWGFLQEVTSRSNIFRHEGATVQIDIHGDYILDCHGQSVDADARGFALATWGEHKQAARHAGNGTPGGSLRSVFRIDKRTAGATVVR